MLKKNKYAVLAMAICCLVCTSVYAAGLPSGYPSLDELMAIGNVDFISKKKDRIVINDSEYFVSRTTTVMRSSGTKTNIYAVRENSKVGIISSGGSYNQYPIATEIWVLPRGFKLLKD
jgi:hypothetical protein